MTNVHRSMVVCGLLLGALVLWGCSSDDSGSSGSGGAAATGAGAAAAPAGGAAAAGAGGTAAPAGGSAAAGAGGAAGGGDSAQCMADFMAMGSTAECASCACTMCATEASALAALDATNRTLAEAVLTCGRDNCCSGTQGYCGDADLVTCSTAAAGPCMTETDAASGATGLANIATPCGDSTNACGAASALGSCLTGDALLAVTGMCPMCAGSTCN